MARKSVATREFLAAFHWYLERNELVASRFAEQVTDAIELIAESPQRWPTYFSPNSQIRAAALSVPSGLSGDVKRDSDSGNCPRATSAGLLEDAGLGHSSAGKRG
jgi:hypothetical protein